MIVMVVCVPQGDQPHTSFYGSSTEGIIAGRKARQSNNVHTLTHLRGHRMG